MTSVSISHSGYAVGVDIGGTKVYTILIDSTNKILARAKKKTREGTPDVVLEKVEVTVNEVLAESGISSNQLDGIGIGFPGPLNPDTGVVIEATNIPGWDHFPLAAKVSEIFLVPTFLDNDVNLGTLGEALAGAGHGADNVIGMFLGTGVGGGIVLGGKLHHGKSGAAGELGHMIIHHGGRKSPRGLRGTVEGLTSRTAITQRLLKEMKNGAASSLKTLVDANEKLRSKSIASAYRENDKLTRKVLSEAAEYVGVTLGSLINLLAPDVIVLGGGVIEAVPESILPIATKVAEQIAVPVSWNHVKIEEAALADDAGAMGGALLARQKVS